MNTCCHLILVRSANPLPFLKIIVIMGIRGKNTTEHMLKRTHCMVIQVIKKIVKGVSIMIVNHIYNRTL